jgi:S1-C subfamily serine protease
MQASQQGVLINSVVPFSVADNHNLRPGEVIMTVMETPVTTPDDAVKLVRALHDQGSRYVAFLVGNDNGTRWVSLPIAAGVT